MDTKSQFSETIINSYYQRFYQGRKSNKPKKQHTNTDIKIIPQKQNLIFHINYQTNTLNSQQKPQINSEQSNHQNPQKNTSTTKNQQSKTIDNSNIKQSTIIPPKNSLILQINIPNFSQKLTKTKTHFKPSPIKNCYQVQNFNHFPSSNSSIKNHTRQNQNNSHFIQVHNYSKSIDFDQWNPQNTLANHSKTISTSPQKQNQFFTLQNFSHIKLHNDKKPRNSKKKQMVDIVKRKQIQQNQKINLSQKNSRKNALKNNFVNLQNKSKSIKNQIQKDQNLGKKALFNDFKPTIELRKRPSTGIPMKKNKSFHLTIQNDQRVESPNPRSNYSIHNRQKSISTNRNHQSLDLQKHSRTSSLKIESSFGLSVKTREIQTLKYVDMSQSQKIKDFFRKSQDLNSNQLKSVVHLEFYRKNSLIHKKIQKKNKFIPEDQFLPWESVQKEDQIIEIIN